MDEQKKRSADVTETQFRESTNRPREVVCLEFRQSNLIRKESEETGEEVNN